MFDATNREWLQASALLISACMLLAVAVGTLLPIWLERRKRRWREREEFNQAPGETAPPHQKIDDPLYSGQKKSLRPQHLNQPPGNLPRVLDTIGRKPSLSLICLALLARGAHSQILSQQPQTT